MGSGGKGEFGIKDGSRLPSDPKVPDADVGRVHWVRIDDLPQVYPHKDAVPALAGDDKERLFASVAEYGVREPIVVYGPLSTILDGHHRLAAAVAAGEKEVPVRWVGDFPAEQADRVAIETNLNRRHLLEYQKYELADKIVKEEEARARRAAAAGGGGGKGRTAERIGKRLGMSKDSVKRAKAVKEQGSPELKADVKAGRKSLKAAAAEVQAARQDKKDRARDRQASLAGIQARGEKARRGLRPCRRRGKVSTALRRLARRRMDKRRLRLQRLRDQRHGPRKPALLAGRPGRVVRQPRGL